MQRVGGDDAAFQIQALQASSRALTSLPSQEARAASDRRVCASHMLIVSGEPQRRAQSPRKVGEGLGQLFRGEQAKQARETVVARREVRQIDDLSEILQVGGAEIGDTWLRNALRSKSETTSTRNHAAHWRRADREPHEE